jgi:hypothetical protein
MDMIIIIIMILMIVIIVITIGVTWLCSGLGHCATSRKVAGSIPDGVSGLFY